MGLIDVQIEPLIKAMNSTGWMRTVSCCQGHPDSEHFDAAYVSFFCKATKVTRLCSILNTVEPECFTVFDYLSVVYSEEIYSSQSDADPGWISLFLRFASTDEDSKLAAFKKLTDAILADMRSKKGGS